MSPSPSTVRAPGILQGTILATISALACLGWALDRSHARGDWTSTPQTVSCRELASPAWTGRTLAGKVHLEGCQVHLPSASVVLDGSAVVGGYARIEDATGPVDAMPVLLRVSAPAQVALLGEALRAQALGDPDAWVRSRMVELAPRMDLQGVVLRGRHLDGTDRDHLALHAGALTPTPGILAAAHTLPSPWPPAGLALLLAALALWGWLRPPSGITTGLGSDASR